MYLIVYDKNEKPHDKPKIVNKYIADGKKAFKLVEEYAQELNCKKCSFIVIDCFECAEYYKCLMHNTVECNTKNCDLKNDCMYCGYNGKCEERFETLKNAIAYGERRKQNIIKSKYNLN